MGELFTWYNALFTAPLFFVFLFAILQIIGVSFQLSGSGETDVDVDADVDMDVDVDMGVDMDVDVEPDIDVDMDVEPDVDVDADVDADADIDTDAEAAGPGIILNVLGFLNVGRVPCMVILMSLFALWGIVGLVCNSIIGVKAVPPLIGFSLGAAFFGSIFGTRYLALGLARLFPASERATRYVDLLGLQARITSGRVTTTFGQAVVTAPDGSRLNISCRIREGEDTLLRGDEILLVQYIPPSPSRRSGYFEVVKFDIALC